jgi:hypothetical protein
MPTQSLMMNPMLATLSPDDQQSLLQLQQRQAIGQALLQQGLQPIDTSNRQVGGMGYRISPLEGLAKMAQMYTGNKISMDSMGKQAQLMGQMYGNAFGTNQPQQAPQQAAVDAGGMTGDQSGQGVISSPVPSGAQLGAAMGGAPQAAPQVAMPNGALTLPGKTPQQSMMLFSMLGPEGYARVLSQWGAPTDATRMAMAAGMPTGPANADALFKANYVPPITGTGTFRDPRTMRPVAYNPEIPAGTNPLYDTSGNVAKVQPIDGAQAAMQGNAAAAAAGSAQFKPIQVYNPQTHQMEYSNEGAVTNPQVGAAPTLTGIFAQQESGGGKTAPENPLQIREGTFKQFAKAGESWTNPADKTAVAQRVLANYSQQYGGDLGRVATAYFSGPGNVAPAGSPTPFIKNTKDANGKTVASYVGDILGRAGGAGFGGSGAAAATPPLGATANANVSQQASADSMKASYAKLQSINSTANGTLESLQKMQALAAKKNPALTAGALGTAVAPIVSPEAAEYEKQRANVIQLLAAQNGTNGSNEGRALTGESVPDYGKPNKAIQDGLQTQINQVRAQQLKANILTPVYNAGDSKSYTALENHFDQVIKPSVMPTISPILELSGAQQQAAVRAAIQGNPALRPSFELLFNAGMLK